MAAINTAASGAEYEDRSNKQGMYGTDNRRTVEDEQGPYEDMYYSQDGMVIKTEPLSDSEDHEMPEESRGAHNSTGGGQSENITKTEEDDDSESMYRKSGDTTEQEEEGYDDSQDGTPYIKTELCEEDYEERESTANLKDSVCIKDDSKCSQTDTDSNSSHENMYLHFHQTPSISHSTLMEIADTVSDEIGKSLASGNNNHVKDANKETPKRVRNSLTIGQKREMCVYKAENPKLSNRRVKLHFEGIWGCKIGRSTIQDVLKKSARWLNMPSSKNYVRTTKSSKNCEMEKILYKWILDHKMRGISLTNTKIVEQARVLGEEFNVDPDFAFSNGWLYCFKQRHGLLNTTNAMTNSPVIIPSPSNFIGQIRSELNFYNLSDVYCMDELGLFYNLKPDKELADTVASGNIQLPRVTVGLCVNANGSDKMKPLVIGKHANPGSFGDKFNPNIYAMYRSNNSAIMTSADFSAWLKEVDNQMRKEHRKILLLIKFTTVHEAVQVNLSNVKLMYLPQTMGSTHTFHPMDVGLIWDFKCYYRMRLLQHFLTCERMGEPQEISLRLALHLLDDSWKGLSAHNVIQRWVSTGILVPTTDCTEMAKEDPLAVLASVFYNYNVSNKMEVDEYLNFDSFLQTSGPLTNPPAYEGNAPPEESVTPVLSLKDAQKGLMKCIQFSEQLENSTGEVKSMWKLMDWLNSIGHDSHL